MTDFFTGATMALCFTAALFFFGFWRESRDRLFAIFALAFAIFGVNRLLLAAIDDASEGRTYVYLSRALAFMLIIVAIVDKNRASNQRR